MSHCVDWQAVQSLVNIVTCEEQLEESLNQCSANDQPILKNRIFDMLDRVKFLLDKKYPTGSKLNTDNPKIIKGESVMKHEHEKARRQAENRIAEVNKYLDDDRIKDARVHDMLEGMREKAYKTLNHINDLERQDHMPYTHTNIGYTTDDHQYRTSDDVHDLMRTAMDAVDRIMPHLVDDADDDWYSDTDDDKVVNMPRWRSARTGRFLPNLYGRGRVRRVRRRSDLDDRYDDHYDDDRYDDDDVRRMADDARRTADEARRVADEARRTADDARRTTDDDRRTDRYDDRRMRTDDDERRTRMDDDRRPGPSTDRGR